MAEASGAMPGEEPEEKLLAKAERVLETDEPGMATGIGQQYGALNERTIAEAGEQAAKRLIAQMSTDTTKYFDGVWQENPRRMIKYRPSILHAYGWIPGLILRNLKGTVFRDVYLHLQVLSMVAWMTFIGETGLGAKDADIQAFIKFFGTPYMGAVINLCMLITFILGLFVTLVVNRWWEVRVQYGMVRSLSIEVSNLIANNLRGAKGIKGEAALADALAQNRRCREEIIRYMNFAHLLLLTDAQSCEKADFADSPQRRVAKAARAVVARIPILRHSEALLGFFQDSNTKLGDVLGDPRKLAKTLRDLPLATMQAGKNMVGAVVGDIKGAIKGEKFSLAEGLKELSKEQIAWKDFEEKYHEMGLCTREEWTLILQQERDGVQQWRTVYQWAASLVAEAVAAGRMEDRLGPPANIHAMLLEIRNAGGRIFTMMNSQLPYTYVHLVSFVCHVFLWILASYFGFVIHAGLPQTLYDVVLHESVSGMDIAGSVGSKRSIGPVGNPVPLSDHWILIRFQIYLMIAFTNVLVQGLLSMHSLLENPFGMHPCKFPLRAYAVDHIRQTRAMLGEPHEREPQAITRIFRDVPAAAAAAPKPAAAEAENEATMQGVKNSVL